MNLIELDNPGKTSLLLQANDDDDEEKIEEESIVLSYINIVDEHSKRVSMSTEDNSLDRIFKLLNQKQFKEAKHLLNQKHFQDWEIYIFKIFWEYILEESTREELENVPQMKDILINRELNNNLSLEDIINRGKELAEETNLEYTLKLLIQLENICSNNLRRIPTYQEIEEIEQLFTGDGDESSSESSKEESKDNNQPKEYKLEEREQPRLWRSLHKKNEINGDNMNMNEKLTSFHTLTIEAFLKKVKRNTELREKLPEVIFHRIQLRDFEYLLEYQYVFQYIVLHKLGKSSYNYNTEHNKTPDDIIQELLLSLEDMEYLEIKLHLLGLVQVNFQYEQVKELVERIRYIFTEEISNIWLKCSNPLKIIALGIERVKIVKYHISGLDFVCDNIIKELVELGVKYEDSVGEDMKIMSGICLDKDLLGRRTIIILGELGEKELLDNPLIMSITHNMWYASYANTRNFGMMSTLYQVIAQRKILFNYLGVTRIVRPRTYLFTREVWIQSPMARYISKIIFEILFIFCMAAVFVHTTNIYLNIITQEEHPSTESRNRAHWWLQLSQIILMLHLYSLIQFYLGIIASNRQNIPLYHFQSDLFLEFFKTSLVCIASYLYFFTPNQSMLWLVKRGFYYLFCVGILIIYMIFLFIMKIRYIKSIGFMLLSLKYTMKDILKYGFLYILQLLAFSLILSIIYFDSRCYHNYFSTLSSLFYSSIGMSTSLFDFGSHATKLQNNIGHYILAAFFICDVLIIANLIIALLTDSYEIAKEDKDIIFVQEILKIIPKYEKSKQFSSVMSAPFPLCVFLFPLIITLISIPKESRIRLNSFILHIEYAFVYIAFTLLLFIFELILLPIVYLLEGLYIFQEFSMEPRKEETKLGQIFKIIFRLSSWYMVGVLILIYYIGKDLIQLFRSLYMKKRIIIDPHKGDSRFNVADFNSVSFEAHNKMFEIFNR